MAVEKAYVPNNPITVEEFYSPGMPDRFVQLVDGELVEMTTPSYWHEKVCGRLFIIFSNFEEKNREVMVGTSNTGFVVGRNPDTLLCPDVALFSRRPWPREQVWGEFAPEIWVEVLSPSNSPMEMTLKRHRLFDAGAEQFWVVDPVAQRLRIYYRDKGIAVYNSDQVVECEGVAQGLRISLEDIFAE